jgi:hypothetical protein
VPVELTFSVTGARCEPHAATPTILLGLRVKELTGASVQALVLMCQVRIEPSRRHYGEGERGRLYELFGEASQWGSSLHPFLWAYVPTTVGAFRGSTELDLPLPCTYDLEVAAAKYFHALEGGEVPLVLLFSGTVFSEGGRGFLAEPVPWSDEARFRLPVVTWRQCMDSYFPGSGWLRLSRGQLDRLARFKAERALPSYDMVVEQLLKEAGVQA